ncbi:MAG: DUF2313 domain-containing protein [Oscillibacter sp.]|nr:DUF2313 domain-containing protein [Oscillibacter sp.]
MRFYANYYPGNYEELITYYPKFYRDVLEMRAILEAHGAVLDELEDNIERVFLNNFIDTADEKAIHALEQFLGILASPAQPLELRRRLVKSYFVGFGKVSASTLEEMISNYTNGPVFSRLEKGYDINHILYLDFGRGDLTVVDVSILQTLIQKKIPAHIACRLTLKEEPKIIPLRIGAADSIVTQIVPRIQPDNLHGTQTIYAGGQPAAVIVKPAAQQPDNLRGGQTVRFGGQPAAVVLKPAPHEPDRPPPPQNTRTGGSGTRVTVRRGTVIDGRIT